ncbi:hypothetical protein TIFTF001_026234 [Ficus carica]|uniref:Uncharacterized protein n=1 Tax=Ficus carica TaxID=3494 RepID=A0AA88DKX8_FICCA|nr:hypothetical protein TIFTF001_026234 [Ficus carica]
MKSAPSSAGSYYFQGWLHGHLARNELPRSERVPVTFRNGYVWTRAPHVSGTTRDMVTQLQNLAEHERDQRVLLSQSSLSEHGWLGFASTSRMPSDRRPEPVTVARMSEPTLHLRSRSTAAQAEVAPDQPGDTSLGSWGPRIADEDLDMVIRRLSPVRGQRPARGLRIEGEGQRGTPTRTGGRGWRRWPTWEKAKARSGPPLRLARTWCPWQLGRHQSHPFPLPQQPPLKIRLPRPADHRASLGMNGNQLVLRPERAGRGKTGLPSCPLPGVLGGSHDPTRRLSPSAKLKAQGSSSSAHRALVAKFEERLSVELAESSKRSDSVQAANDGVNKQIEALCIMLSGYAAAKGYASHMADEVKSANSDARHARRAEKEAKAAREAAEEARKAVEDRAKVAEDRAKEAEGRLQFTEELIQKADQAVEEAEISKAEMEKALRGAEQELASARAKHEKYVRVALPAALEEARAQAVADFLGSEDYNERVAQMYREGMRDMKASFTAANPSLVGVDWSFVATESEETVAEDPPEEGEVTVGLGVSHPTPTLVGCKCDPRTTRVGACMGRWVLVGHVQFWSVPGHKTCGSRTIGVRCLQGQVGPGRARPILVGARS